MNRAQSLDSGKGGIVFYLFLRSIMPGNCCDTAITGVLEVASCSSSLHLVLLMQNLLHDHRSKSFLVAFLKICALLLCWPFVQAICQQGGDILNIGFGLGLVDCAIQSRSIKSHTIVEAHPDVLQRMEEGGWMTKENVRVVRGRWQDVLPQLHTYDGE